MPILVHLADERDTNKILHAGIKLGKYGQGIYCMPVLPDFYVTHQWLRELKREGTKTLVGVYFRLASTEMVYAGKYGKPHQFISLGQAIKDIMELEEPLGYELIIGRKIEPNEIKRIRQLPQQIGWRYFPDSNGKRPCNCEYCLKGTIKGTRTKNRLDSQC